MHCVYYVYVYPYIYIMYFAGFYTGWVGGNGGSLWGRALPQHHAWCCTTTCKMIELSFSMHPILSVGWSSWQGYSTLLTSRILPWLLRARPPPREQDLGNLHKFRPEVESFTVYLERTKMFFTANNVLPEKRYVWMQLVALLTRYCVTSLPLKTS